MSDDELDGVRVAPEHHKVLFAESTPLHTLENIADQELVVISVELKKSRIN